MKVLAESLLVIARVLSFAGKSEIVGLLFDEDVPISLNLKCRLFWLVGSNAHVVWMAGMDSSGVCVTCTL